MSEHASIQKQVKTYIAVFVALAVLTVLTVTVSYLNLPRYGSIAVALLIASVKVGLVMAFFMHLVSEKKIIYWILALAFLFFIHLLLFPSWHAL